MALIDWLLTKQLRLPRATSTYMIERDLPQVMRDGVVLLADHYAPTGQARSTILVRGPYGRRSIFAAFFARPYAARGYHVVIQSCRGTYGSGGVLDPMSTETEDGADTVAWLREQPWFTGSFATVGMSYLGFTQWCLLADPPPELFAAVVIDGPHDIADVMHGGGAFSLELALGWSNTTSRQEEHSQLGGLLRGGGYRRTVEEAMRQVPVLDAGEKALDGRAHWWREWSTRRDVRDPYWEPRQARAALTSAAVPVLVVAGWQDLFLTHNLEAYRSLRDSGADVALTVGPWTHASTVTKGSGVVTREALDWIGSHLLGQTPAREAPVRIELEGVGWRSMTSWPPASRPRRLHLDAAGWLGGETAGGAATWTYDPSDPTPSVGGHTLMPGAGRKDNRELEARSDVLTFTSAVLDADLDVIGVPVVELDHRSDNPHSDVFVRLCEVSPKGVSLNVSERLVRLDAVGEHVSIELRPTAHRFAAGSRIRLQVSGGAHPTYERNLGTGADPARSTEMRPSHRTLTFGQQTYLELPIC